MEDELPAPLLKPADVARVLNVTVTQVYTLMRSGDLPALKIGKKGVWRVSRDTLDEYLAALEAEARTRGPVTDPDPRLRRITASRRTSCMRPGGEPGRAGVVPHLRDPHPVAPDPDDPAPHEPAVGGGDHDHLARDDPPTTSAKLRSASPAARISRACSTCSHRSSARRSAVIASNSSIRGLPSCLVPTIRGEEPRSVVARGAELFAAFGKFHLDIARDDSTSLYEATEGN